MKRPQLFFSVSLLLFLVCSYLLFSGSPLLNFPLGKNDTLPLGSFSTWAIMISLPFALYWGSSRFRTPQGKAYKVLSVILKILIVLGILWLPLSYFLAGNMNFNFSEVDSFRGGQLAMKIFWVLSTGIPLSSILVLLVSGLLFIFKKKK
ncbi:hypothetical protein AB8P51_10200 [Muriicola sp. SD30]|uniref:hypothetical protein n=1 Tax=Muriicola sp. SD30 TaxID=3240936 RepID=UPI0035105790